jgi:hypothetical protein
VEGRLARRRSFSGRYNSACSLDAPGRQSGVLGAVAVADSQLLPRMEQILDVDAGQPPYVELFTHHPLMFMSLGNQRRLSKQVRSAAAGCAAMLQCQQWYCCFRQPAAALKAWESLRVIMSRLLDVAGRLQWQRSI